MIIGVDLQPDGPAQLRGDVHRTGSFHVLTLEYGQAQVDIYRPDLEALRECLLSMLADCNGLLAEERKAQIQRKVAAREVAAQEEDERTWRNIEAELETKEE